MTALTRAPDPQMTLGEGKETKMARRKGESQEKVNANPVTCDYGREVQGRLHSNLPLCPPVKGSAGAQ